MVRPPEPPDPKNKKQTKNPKTKPKHDRRNHLRFTVTLKSVVIHILHEPRLLVLQTVGNFSAPRTTALKLSSELSLAARISTPKIDVLIEPAGEDGKMLDLQHIHQVQANDTRTYFSAV